MDRETVGAKGFVRVKGRNGLPHFFLGYGGFKLQGFFWVNQGRDVPNHFFHAFLRNILFIII